MQYQPLYDHRKLETFVWFYMSLRELHDNIKRIFIYLLLIIFCFRNVSKNMGERIWNYSFSLWWCRVSTHCVRFSRSRLSIGQNCSIITFEHFIDYWSRGIHIEVNLKIKKNSKYSVIISKHRVYKNQINTLILCAKITHIRWPTGSGWNKNCHISLINNTQTTIIHEMNISSMMKRTVLL